MILDCEEGWVEGTTLDGDDGWAEGTTLDGEEGCVEGTTLGEDGWVEGITLDGNDGCVEGTTLGEDGGCVEGTTLDGNDGCVEGTTLGEDRLVDTGTTLCDDEETSVCGEGRRGRDIEEEGRFVDWTGDNPFTVLFSIEEESFLNVCIDGDCWRVFVVVGKVKVEEVSRWVWEIELSVDVPWHGVGKEIGEEIGEIAGISWYEDWICFGWNIGVLIGDEEDWLFDEEFFTQQGCDFWSIDIILFNCMICAFESSIR